MDICAKQIQNSQERQLAWSWGKNHLQQHPEMGAKRIVPRSKSNEKMLIRWKERVLVGAGRMDRFRENVSGAWANDKE